MAARKLLVGVLIGVSLIFTGCLGKFYQYRKNPPPTMRQGTLKLPQLQSKVEVYFDQYGVPQVFTENEHDLFFSIGYLQAQDRLFEMVMIRGMSEGRLTEILGDLPIGIAGGKPMDYDIHQRVWGIKYLGEVGEALVKKYQPEIYNQTQAYCDGVNAYIALNQKKLPVELQVLNYRPENFRPADVFSLGMFMGMMLGENYQEELFRYAVMKEYGWDMTWKLANIYTQMGPTVVPPELLKNRLAQPVTDLLKDTPRPEELDLSPKSALALAQVERSVREVNGFLTPFASNNWAVSGKLTKDGHAILCNDPHLEHEQPSLFYLMRVKGAGFDTYGVSFPGEPYLVLGHTRKLAWAATTSEADVQDIFVEKVNPKNSRQYLFKGEWKDFTVREEDIKVRIGFTDKYRVRKLMVRQSIHGPILNETLKKFAPDTPPLAVRWAAWDFCRDLRVFNALIASRNVDEFMAAFEKLNREKPVELMNIGVMYNFLMKGQSIEDFKKSMNSIVVPDQSWLAADADGHIAYIPGGLVPIRAKGRGISPVPGWTGEYEWTGFIPLFELPYMIDPERGWVVTANNEVVDSEWYPYTFGNDYANGYRAARIEELIKTEQPLDMDKMIKIQNDVYSQEGAKFAPLIVKAVEKKGAGDARLKEAADYLRKWDYQTSTDSVATTIYYATMQKLYALVPERYFEPKFCKTFLNTYVMSFVVQRWLYDGDDSFFHSKLGPGKLDGVDDYMVESLKEALAGLEKNSGKDMSKWQWGKLHTMTWSHPLGMGPFKAMNYGPFPEQGADQTVRNSSFTGQGKHPFAAVHGPVLRHIIDMGKVDEALMVIDGSESGRWLDPHYTDMHQLWFNSKYDQAVMDEGMVRKNAKSQLNLVP